MAKIQHKDIPIAWSPHKGVDHYSDAEHFIAGAIKQTGALHRELGVPQGKNIPAQQLAAAAKKPGVEGRRARFAQTLKKLHS